MWKEKIYKIVTKHGNKLKVFGALAAIMVMLLAIKTYVNYSTITEEIGKVNSNISSLEQEIAYSEKFYSKYLDSDYSIYFLSHKNNVLFDGEYIIKISTNQKEEPVIKQTSEKKVSESPKESRKEFIKSRFN